MRRQIAWGVVWALAAFGVASAQETTSGSIAGTVVDTTGGAVPGALVTIESPDGTRTLTTDNNGRFFAPYLTPGRHTIRVRMDGFAPVEQKGIQVRLGQRIELSYTLRVTDLTEVVEVVGTAPVVDVTSTTAGGVLDSDQLKRLPVSRNFLGTLYMVPGVSDSSGVGNANPSISGASGLENNYIVDGVNITNAGFGGVGTYSIVFGSLGTGVTTDFIKETQVKTAGFEAEFGQSTGGVVNVVTKSGSNRFQGSVFGYFSPDALEADRRQLQTPNGTVNTTGTENIDFGLALSGPLVRDRLFAFAAFNPQYQNRTFIAPEGFPLESLGEVERKRRVLSYAGKLTWQPSSNHRFNVTVFGDPSRGENGPQRFTSLKGTNTSQFSELEYGGHNQSVRYDGIISPSWLVEASVARAENTFEEIPSVNEHQVRDRTVVPNVFSGGIGFFDQASDGENLQYSLKSTHLFDLGGSHQLRYGVQYEDIDFTRAFSRTGPTFVLPNGVRTRTGARVAILSDQRFGRIYRVERANFGDPPLTNQRYLNWFVQDTWQIGKRLTVRPGVRWERQKLVGGSPLCFDDEVRVGDGGSGSGNPQNCEYTWDNNWSPRIGATYDLFGNGKSKIYASWGRFLSKIPNDLAARALSADAGVTRADYFDAGLTEPIPEGVEAGGTTRHFIVAGLHPALFENDTQSTYHDEFLGGIEFEVARSVSLGVRYIHRSLPVVLEDYAQASPVHYDLNFPGLGSVEYIIDNISPDLRTLDGRELGIPLSSFEDPVHKYDAVEVTLNKSFSDNWSLLTSYRWSKLSGNFEGFFRSDNGQSDPSITSLYDFPTNDPSYTLIGVPRFGYGGDIRYQGDTLGRGVLPNDRTHQFKIFGTYTLGDVTAGLGLLVGSGRSLTGFAANPTYQNSGEIPVSVRGEGIDTVDGFLTRTPTEVLLDLHLDYTLQLGDAQRMVVLADVFNLLDDQDPTDYDNYTELGFRIPNPNFGLPANGGGSSAASFQNPRQFRLGVRLEWH